MAVRPEKEARKGPGCREPRRKIRLGLPCRRGDNSLASPAYYYDHDRKQQICQGVGCLYSLSWREREFWETQGMTLSKGLGINPALFSSLHFSPANTRFPWRARQDSNL